MIPPIPPARLHRAYRLLRATYGHRAWWPAGSPFEVCVGAILTQNTAWRNVERAIAALKSARALAPRILDALPVPDLARLIRPSGHFNLKARRLKAFARVLVGDFGASLARLFAGDTPTVRARLLAIHGIGPETADSMLLYAGGHARFVVDAYTRRVFARHGWCAPDASYAELQAVCERARPAPPKSVLTDYWGDYHAQLVEVAKRHCRKRVADCAGCPLKPLLPRAGPLLA